jgi:hypothetical protein
MVLTLRSDRPPAEEILTLQGGKDVKAVLIPADMQRIGEPFSQR